MLPFDAIRALVAALCLMAGTPALAHMSQNTEIRIDASEQSMSVEIVMPVRDYAIASGNEATDNQEALERARRAIAGSLNVLSENGTPWVLTIERIEFTTTQGPSDMRATLIAVPPQDASARSFALRWSMLSAASPGSFAMVYLNGDSSGAIGEQSVLLGALTPGNTTLFVELGARSSFVLGANAFLVGMHHILEGYDHLLFLLALMLPAPLVCRSGKWSRVRRTRSTIIHIALIVTAFTLGHSLTLALGWFWPVTIPALLVESIIAVSVLISAAHAIRPIFPDKEHVIGFAFGLIHGLAFATLLDQSGLAAGGGLAALGGFTLGIEAVQLGIVACVMPALILLSRTRRYAPFRIGAGIMVFLAAALWLFNRITGTGDQLVGRVELALSYGGFVLLGLLGIAAVIWVRESSADQPRNRPLSSKGP